MKTICTTPSRKSNFRSAQIDFLPSPLGEGKKKAAFTLAEVLITLGIIGVVAALTLPTLIQNYHDKATITKLKKMYSTLQQAYLMNKALDEIKLGNTQAHNAEAAQEIAAVFVPYLHISKDCGTDKPGCVNSGTYKYLSGSNATNYNYGGTAAYRVLLNDGSCIWFRRVNPSLLSAIFYDVNGENPPNMWGKDLFEFVVVNDRVLPTGIEGTERLFDTDCNPNGQGIGCAAWVLQQENFEYLKCSGLQLNGPKKKCN
ncbi:type II secretion system protein [bacterium]|nr:type II secretion system protein [bacterium]